MLDEELQEDFFSSQSGPPDAKQSLFFGEDDDDDDDDEVVVVRDESPKKEEANGTLKRTSTSTQENGHAIKRPRNQIDEPNTPSSSHQASLIPDTPPSEKEQVWDKRFVGTFIVSAWSLSKGSNYVRQGDQIRIERQRPKVAGQETLAKQATKPSLKSGKKQTKLTFKTAPIASKKAKAKEDYIVRFSNMRGK